jgi:alpha-galactosidase
MEKLAVKWAELGLKGRLRVHDVWRQKDIRDAAEEFTTEVGPHGVTLIHLIPAD